MATYLSEFEYFSTRSLLYLLLFSCMENPSTYILGFYRVNVKLFFVGPTATPELQSWSGKNFYEWNLTVATFVDSPVSKAVDKCLDLLTSWATVFVSRNDYSFLKVGSTPRGASLFTNFSLAFSMKSSMSARRSLACSKTS